MVMQGFQIRGPYYIAALGVDDKVPLNDSRNLGNNTEVPWKWALSKIPGLAIDYGAKYKAD